MRAARIENGLVADLWEVPSLDCYGDDVQLVAAADHVQLGASYDAKTGQFVNQSRPQISLNIDEIRAAAYRNESDPLFFKYQRDEATKEQWLASIDAIKARFPKVE